MQAFNYQNQSQFPRHDFIINVEDDELITEEYYPTRVDKLVNGYLCSELDDEFLNIRIEVMKDGILQLALNADYIKHGEIDFVHKMDESSVLMDIYYAFYDKYDEHYPSFRFEHAVGNMQLARKATRNSLIYIDIMAGLDSVTPDVTTQILRFLKEQFSDVSMIVIIPEKPCEIEMCQEAKFKVLGISGFHYLIFPRD